nr:unnamed protein product [Digitaria exilis]
MPPRKRRRTCEPRRAAASSKPDASPPLPELPGNIMAEIAARSGDAATIFRCAATCKLLRREILRPDFIRRVTAGGPDAAVPSRFLGVIDGETSSSFSVVHPITEAAETFATRHMAPFLSRSGAAGLVEEYELLSSRGGLVVLRRRVINRRRWSQRRSDIGWLTATPSKSCGSWQKRSDVEDADPLYSFCRFRINVKRAKILEQFGSAAVSCEGLPEGKARLVSNMYDPMTDTRVFFTDPPDVGKSPYHPRLGCGSVSVIDISVLLTAGDGINTGCCSYMLLAADMDRSLDMSVRIRVQTLSSDAGGKWGPLTSAELGQCPWWCSTSWDRCIDAGIVVGGVVHSLLHAGASIALDVGEYILTYDVGAATVGSVDIPEHRRVPNLRSYSQLGSSPDGKLSLLVADQLMVSVWVLSGGGYWSRHAEVDMIPWCLSLVPQPQDDDHGEVVLGSLGDQSRAVLWRLVVGGREFCFLLDMETKETRLDWAERKGIPCEVDLASRLSSMKFF